MRKIQRNAILALSIFWYLIFSVIFIFFLYWVVQFFIALGSACGVVAWICGIGVMIYMICFSLAMQA